MKKLAPPLTALLVGLVIGLTGAPAAAATAYGSWGSLFGAPAIYQGRGGVDNVSRQAIAQTRATGNVPSGWLGAKAQGVNQTTGAICVATGWYYNSATTTMQTVASGHPNCNGVPVYAWSVSRGWDSPLSSYSEYWGAFSPALNF